MDKEGQYTYSLRPRTDKVINKLMCEISIKDNVKTVTLRSTYKVENQTLYPLELTLVDSSGHPVYPVEKIGEEFVGSVRLHMPISLQPRVTITLFLSKPLRRPGYEYNQTVRNFTGLLHVCLTHLILMPGNIEGFGYRWSPPIKWEDLANVRQSGITIRCPHVSQNEAPFRFQIWPVKDIHPLYVHILISFLYTKKTFVGHIRK